MPKALSGADGLKNEKHQIQLIYTVFCEGRASPDENKIDENPLSELIFSSPEIDSESNGFWHPK